MNNTIYFSQIIEDERQYGRCYQKNDPTSEDFFDLLPDDGGSIKIPEIGTIQKLFTSRNVLFVFASNGVWMIRGSSGLGFTASDYVVQRLSNDGTNSPMSFVDIRGLPMWWGENSIFSIVYNPQFDSYNVQSETDDTIKSFIINIPASNRRNVKGVFNKERNLIQWLYYSEPTLLTDGRTRYNAILCYNAITKAFFPWTIGYRQGGSVSDVSPSVRGLMYIGDAEQFDNPKIKYVTTYYNTSGSERITFSEERSTGYYDWSTYAEDFSSPDNELDYTSYAVSGYRLDGEAQRFFQAPYVFFYLETEDNSSCFIQPLFDFTNSGNSGKWGSKQQAYKTSLTTFRDVTTRRLKFRGKGRALQMKFSSETGKPFNVIGWSMKESANADV